MNRNATENKLEFNYRKKIFLLHAQINLFSAQCPSFLWMSSLPLGDILIVPQGSA
jgi:hypothetical protein